MGLLLIPQVLLAQNNCNQNVTALKKGEPAPCDGFLFSKEQELKVRTQDQEIKLLKTEVEIQGKLIESYTLDVETLEEIRVKEREKTELWRKQAEESTEKLAEATGDRFGRDMIMILLGIGLTVGAGFAVGAAN